MLGLRGWFGSWTRRCEGGRGNGADPEKDRREQDRYLRQRQSLPGDHGQARRHVPDPTRLEMAGRPRIYGMELEASQGGGRCGLLGADTEASYWMAS